LKFGVSDTVVDADAYNKIAARVEEKARTESKELTAAESSAAAAIAAQLLATAAPVVTQSKPSWPGRQFSLRRARTAPFL